MNQIEEYYYNQIKSDSESENEESKEEISKNEEKINEKEENINKEKKKNELIKIPTIKMRKKAKSVQKKYKIFSIDLKIRMLNEVK